MSFQFLCQAPSRDENAAWPRPMAEVSLGGPSEVSEVGEDERASRALAPFQSVASMFHAVVLFYLEFLDLHWIHPLSITL